MVRFGLDRPASAMKLTTVLFDADGGNLLVCETDPISAAEGRRLTATGAQVLAKPAVMSTAPATEIVKAFFACPRYNTGNNSMLLPGIIALTSSDTFDASASCSSAAANSSSSSSSCN